MSRMLKHEYRVTDPAALRVLVGTAVDREGSFLSAARTAVAGGRAFESLNRAEKKRVRAAQQKLVRYGASGATRITENSRSLLESLLSRAEVEELDDLLLPPYARARAVLYRWWMHEVLGGTKLADDMDPQTDIARARKEERQALIRHIKQHCPAAVVKLREAIRAGAVTGSEERAQIAFARILDPLLCFGLTGGVERHWKELSVPELRAYINAATRAEKILLKRGTHLERVTNRAPQDDEFSRPLWETLRDRP